jgi:hypothetical protein
VSAIAPLRTLTRPPDKASGLGSKKLSSFGESKNHFKNAYWSGAESERAACSGVGTIVYLESRVDANK